MDQEKIGKFIKQLREEHNLTQDELGEKLNINGRSVSKWERGLNTPDLANLKFLGDLFNVSINEIVSGERNPNVEQINTNYVKGIKFFNKRTKLKYLLFLIGVILSFVFMLGAIYFYNDYNKNEVYSLESTDPEYSVKGYFIINQKMNLIIINEIKYDGGDLFFTDDLLVNKLTIDLYTNNDECLIFYKQKSNENVSYIDLLQKVSFSNLRKSNDKKIDINSLYLKIEYFDDGKNVERIINLKTDKVFSNDKIKY